MAVYPLLFGTTPQADPGLTHTTAISNVTQLQAMTVSGNYYLTGNIDASITSTWNGGAGFDPIGTNLIPFVGTFDGCGYTISNLFINRASSRQGLFGFAEPPAKIANVTLSVDITAGGSSIGGLVGFCQANDTGDVLIQNCHTSGNVDNYSHENLFWRGGLVGIIRREPGHTGGYVYVYDCSSSCSITIDENASTYIGGLIGTADHAYIINCHASGNISNAGYTGSYVGGFLGGSAFVLSDQDLHIYFCYATGNVLGGSDDFFGGFAGLFQDGTEINSCSATGDVSGGSNVGGFVGLVDGSTTDVYISNCYAQGDVTATTANAGGFCGSADDSEDHFENCYSIGSVSSPSNEGGFIGLASAVTDVISSFWDEQASGITTTSYNKGVGEGTRFFSRQANFPGWDFVNVWYLPASGKQVVLGKPRCSYLVGSRHTTQRRCYI